MNIVLIDSMGKVFKTWNSWLGDTGLRNLDRWYR